MKVTVHSWEKYSQMRMDNWLFEIEGDSIEHIKNILNNMEIDPNGDPFLDIAYMLEYDRYYVYWEKEENTVNKNSNVNGY